MAKHKKHHKRHGRRHLGAIDALELGKSTKVKDVLLGAAAGVGLGVGFKLLLSSVSALQLATPDALANNAMPVGAVVAGGGLYLGNRRKHPDVARGLLWGSLLAGGAAVLWEALQSYAPAVFGDVVSVNVGPGARAKQLKGYRGLLVTNKDSVGFPPRRGLGMMTPNPTLGGLIASNPQGHGVRDMSQFIEGDADPMESEYQT